MTIEDIKAIMDQVVEHATLLETVVLVSTEELKKITTKDQDQPSESISVQDDIVNKDGDINQNKGDTLDKP